MARLQFVFLLMLGILVALSSATSAPVFCKCTCNKNSTIIPLDPAANPESLRLRSAAFAPLDSPLIHDRNHPALERKAPSSTCAQCTKAFCLLQELDICKDAKEEDVVTLCFQRDSNKDKIIVWGFIIGTTGLLGYAVFKRVKAWREARGGGIGGQYASMPVR